MGRSRKRTNKFKTKVSIRPKRRPFTRSKVPTEIANGRTDVQTKLGRRPLWRSADRLEANYAENKLLADPNSGFGRNSSKEKRKERTEGMDMECGGDAISCGSDDDLRQMEGKPRRDGRRQRLPRPTLQQRRTIEALIDAHGSNLEAMVRDQKLNPMLMPASKLRRLIEGFNMYGGGGRCSFRVPVKGL